MGEYSRVGKCFIFSPKFYALKYAKFRENNIVVFHEILNQFGEIFAKIMKYFLKFKKTLHLLYKKMSIFC